VTALSGAGTAKPEVRLAEFVAALSLATDLGNGFGLEKTLRSCLLALALGREIALGQAELSELYYLVQMRSVACTAFAAEEAVIAAGDDISARRLMTAFDSSRGPSAALEAVRKFGSWTDGPRRAATAIRFVASSRSFGDHMCLAHFDVGTRMAARLGMPSGVRAGLGQVWERWDGRGMPNRLRGDALTRPVRIMHIAFVAEIAARNGGPEAAAAEVRGRRGGHFDPELADLFVREAPALFAAMAVDSAWETLLDQEPQPRQRTPERAADVAGVLADFSDLKSPWTLGHSTAVAELAAAAGREAGLSEDAISELKVAGLVHDLGRVSVPNGVWEKAGQLSPADWERVRLHPYYGERVLAYAPSFRAVAHLAARHHERLDGSGYHRGVAGPELSLPARLLAAADVYHACLEPRPYRAALSRSDAASELAAEVKAGRIDARAAEAVTVAAGHARADRLSGWPAGLSDREVEVLRAVARGLRSKQVASQLGISVRTVDHHVDHIYAKVGVRSRAGLALFALEQGLLPD
jgi:HD-GYP domain-containing protein (c-di-GMP phosphodiesterase class II)/DNA-binding CsgD family transcriptional regulator